MIRLHQKRIGQNGFLYNTMHHLKDAERMEIGSRQDQVCHINKEQEIKDLWHI